jgi:hypothetical protein
MEMGVGMQIVEEECGERRTGIGVLGVWVFGGWFSGRLQCLSMLYSFYDALVS